MVALAVYVVADGWNVAWYEGGEEVVVVDEVDIV